MKNKAQAISIIIPAYNEENHLEACLQSITAQTIAPLEILVVDNNSTDGTAALARRFKGVKVLKESKQGVVFARNRGFNAAAGTIIGRIDADTVLPPDWVERVLAFYKAADRSNYALTGGCYFYNIRLPHFYGWIQGQIAFRLNRLLLGHYITFGSNMALPTALWHKIASQACHRNDIHEDLDLSIHLHRLGGQITYHQSLKIGMKMRRVRSGRHELMANLMLWPQTLRVHQRWTWVFGWVGAVLLYCTWPLAPVMEWIARVCGRPPLAED